MKKKTLTLLVLMLGFGIFCGHSIAQDRSLSFQEITIECIDTEAKVRSVVRSQSEYEQMFDKHKTYPQAWYSQSRPCSEYQLPEIDFSQHTLLGATWSMSHGCYNPELIRKVLINQREKVILYDVEAQIPAMESYHCDMFHVHHNFILVPRISKEYEVQFDVSTVER